MTLNRASTHTQRLVFSHAPIIDPDSVGVHRNFVGSDRVDSAQKLPSTEPPPSVSSAFRTGHRISDGTQTWLLSGRLEWAGKPANYSGGARDGPFCLLRNPA
jgi:hypothetical protein